MGDKYVQAAIRAVGGLPVIIPAFGGEFEAEQGVIEALDRLLDNLDGVLLTGSPSNVEPHHYEGDPSRAGTAHDPARDATILPLIRHAIDDGVPLIAICRGAQEVNVALGGTLHQLVHEVPGRRDHRSPRTSDIDVNYAAGARGRDRRGRPAASPGRRAPGDGELAARPGRRSAGAARPRSRRSPTTARSRRSACPMRRPSRWRCNGIPSIARWKIRCR